MIPILLVSLGACQGKEALTSLSDSDKETIVLGVLQDYELRTNQAEQINCYMEWQEGAEPTGLREELAKHGFELIQQQPSWGDKLNSVVLVTDWEMEEGVIEIRLHPVSDDGMPEVYSCTKIAGQWQGQFVGKGLRALTQ